MNQPLVGIIVLTWNNAAEIRDCIKSLLAQTYSAFKLVIVDNASTDDTVKIIQQEFPQIELIVLKENLFYAGGNNFGVDYMIKTYDPGFVAILNPDTVVEDNWVESQVAHMQMDVKVGIIGPKILFAEGFGIADKTTTGQQKVINSVGMAPGGYLFPADKGFGEFDRNQYKTIEQVYAVSGISMFLRSEMVKKTGLFFTPLQMYFEDVDLCLRAKRAGWKVVYLPTTTVHHKHMESAKLGESTYFYWSRRNYLVLISRNYSFKRFLGAVRTLAKESSLLQFIEIMCAFLKLNVMN